MKVLALEHDRPGVADSDFKPLLEAEALAVWDLMQAGVIREIYFREDAAQAVLVLEAESTTEAQHVLASLPLAQAGLSEFETIGLRPYPELARLFRS